LFMTAGRRAARLVVPAAHDGPFLLVPGR